MIFLAWLAQIVEVKRNRQEIRLKFGLEALFL
jgi:hypothetical protein